MKALCRDCLAPGPPAARCPACGSPRRLAHPELDTLSITHIDCDAFYASVEKRDRPELRDRPVIVGGGRRGVVTTCCYIARTFGVRSAMPMFKALDACPQAVVLPPDFPRYRAESRRLMDMMRDLTPLVQPLSLDEAWLDLSGTERLHQAPPALTLARLQARIEAETGLTVSIGLASNKFLAKIASDLDKPRGFSVIGAAEAQDFLAGRSVRLLPGVGPVMARNLERAGFERIGQIARTDLKVLATRFGDFGLRLHDMSLGRDGRPVNPGQARKSISAETTFETDLSDPAELDAHLVRLAERVARQARAAGQAGRVATLKLKTPDFRILTRRRTLAASTQSARSLTRAARDLLSAELSSGADRAFRLIGVGLSDLSAPEDGGGDLFAPEDPRTLAAERAADAIRARFGPGILAPARELAHRKPSREGS
ncbi:MAG: DNA polymerase IV [Phenylobacterium sp.]|uniref:DNA polymerase IV n=1 Tax=Phenylobacterium sp. TaxID=1871053 RepID=UPI0025FEAD27|nr:DNA polymerase IV [Phenylobacterium sp.]MCA6243962.1 DNA polymerase IV [Phenylobacterium sp.]MCA6270938.1 DNA polymerase IV [Phenylobacterium sp.]MCA6276384.1 DNA polymerase IV [Phenylobacterium sp.]MCA6294034.1 DNA polymerase IV [Phenylobacterium sp.]